jgi:uncharacterized LabA/DUF88 family protein
MMQKEIINYAFIDSQNVNLGVRGAGWQLDFGKFRIYLSEKYSVSRAYLFIGYLPGNEQLYAKLQEMGYICIFKPTLVTGDNIIKGNCDAELVLQAMADQDEYDRAIIVTGDGDFYCLANYLLRKEKLTCVLIPNQEKFSALLKTYRVRPYLRYMNSLKKRLAKVP